MFVHAGRVKQRVSDSYTKYAIEWIPLTNGAPSESGVKSIHIFGEHTPQWPINKGDHVLAPTNKDPLCFLPGTSIEGTYDTIELITGEK